VLFGSPFLLFFLNHKIELQQIDKTILDTFSNLDDYDVLGAIKQWQFHDDFVLSSLSKMVINRNLLKIELNEDKVNKIKFLELKEKYMKQYAISENEVGYFVFKGKLKNEAYSKSSEPIRILKKDKTIENVVEASDQMHLKALSKTVIKYFICYPKAID
jgi:hypothetical protein